MSQTTPTDDEITLLAHEFIMHGDQVKAWRLTFPNSKAALNTQYTRASEAFARRGVQVRIEELRGLSKKQSEKEFTMSVAELKKVLAVVMKKGVSEGKLSAVVSAVAELNKMDGNNAPSKTEISGGLKIIRVRSKGVDKSKKDE